MDESLSQLDSKVIELIAAPLFMWPNLANSLSPAEAQSVVKQLLIHINRTEKLALFLSAYSSNTEENTQNFIHPPPTSDDNCLPPFMRWRCCAFQKRLLRKFILWLIKVGDSLDE
jgi:hypothetical protein